MKPRKQSAGAGGSGTAAAATAAATTSSTREPSPDDAAPGLDDEEDLNSGFGNWLRSPEGISYMRLFVVANSLVMFMTVSWPQISTVLEMIGEYFAEWN